MDKSLIPLLFLTSSLITTFLTAPLAKLSGSGVAVRNRLLAGGFIVMIAANAVFALEPFASMQGASHSAQCSALHPAVSRMLLHLLCLLLG